MVKKKLPFHHQSMSNLVKMLIHCFRSNKGVAMEDWSIGSGKAWSGKWQINLIDSVSKATCHNCASWGRCPCGTESASCWGLLDQRKSKVPQYRNAFQVALAYLEAKFIWQSFALHQGYPCPILFGSCRIAYILYRSGDVRNKHISKGQPIKKRFLLIFG